MLDARYLRAGLNALSRAHEGDYFADGHRGGAMVAAYFLCRENDAEPGAVDAIAAGIDRSWANSPLCAPLPDTPADPTLLARLTNAMESHLPGMRQAGHNVILPALALRAFALLPDAVTEERVAGICRLVESFSVSDDGPAADVELPDMADAAAATEFILDEFVQCTRRFDGRGQGWSGHLLTYGAALLDLHQLGLSDLAAKAEDGFRIYVCRIRSGPQENDKPRPEHQPLSHFPLEESYWQNHGGDWNFGHVLKYPYGFYRLLSRARDGRIKERALAAAFRVL